MATTSNNRITDRKQIQQTKTAFCTFCFNLGKPPAIYNSHYIRETPAKDSRIICPELKSCTCMGCGKKGHTISNCKSNQSNQTQKDHRMGEQQRHGIDAPYKNRYYQNPTKPYNIQPKNIYHLLTIDDEKSDIDDDETTTIVSEISNTNASIASSATTENDVSMKSYAAALLSVLHSKQPILQSAPTAAYDFSLFKNAKRYASWADAESSDDEE